jgi:hypothetical protein
MTTFLRLFLAAAAASALGVTALAQTPASRDNVMEFVIGNGPHAGTYKLPTANIMCMHFKQRKEVAVAYKDFDATDLQKIGEGGIKISDPDPSGPQRGEVLVAFGARADKRAARYSVSIPGDGAGPFTLARSGKTADLAFQGKTKDGISLRVTARCLEIDEL